MIHEVVATTLLIDDLKGDQTFTMGPYDTDEECLSVARELANDLHTADRIITREEMLEPAFPETMREEYSEALLITVDTEAIVSMAIWELDHRE